MENPDGKIRKLTWWERQQLERQGCQAEDWEAVEISDGTDFNLMRDIIFLGHVRLGLLGGEEGAGDGIFRSTLKDCTVSDHVLIRDVSMLEGCTIGTGAHIENVGNIRFEPEAMCGLGVAVGALDETGSRPVYLYPGLSSQMAELMARNPM